MYIGSSIKELKKLRKQTFIGRASGSNIESLYPSRLDYIELVTFWGEQSLKNL